MSALSTYCHNRLVWCLFPVVLRYIHPDTSDLKQFNIIHDSCCKDTVSGSWVYKVTQRVEYWVTDRIYRALTPVYIIHMSFNIWSHQKKPNEMGWYKWKEMAIGWDGKQLTLN